MSARRAAAATVIGLLALGAAAELRLTNAERALTDRWRDIHVEPHGRTLLGISFRPAQAEAMGLEPQATFEALLAYPFDLVRLGAYWDRMEPDPGRSRFGELDVLVEAAERSGKRIVLCVGGLKTFGYPESFVPKRHLRGQLEGLVEPDTHGGLLEGAVAFIRSVVRRYRDRGAVLAWQLEHDPGEPLGWDHPWRLSAAFLRRELEAVRGADPSRPVMMTGFLATSTPLALAQWWLTRDQGDSLRIAERLADIVGIDYYPRHAIGTLGRRTVYLDGSATPWQRRRRVKLFERLKAHGRRLMISEGQAEPWEAKTIPPSPTGRAMYSCMPEHVIENYNECVRAAGQAGAPLEAYFFWGAEYWIARSQRGDPRYLAAFTRVLESA